jgi:hypothetical protein
MERNIVTVSELEGGLVDPSDPAISQADGSLQI